MNAPVNVLEQASKAEQALASTHEVSNVSREMRDYNMFTQDAALQEAVKREAAAWAEADLQKFGKLTGSADYRALGTIANHMLPELETHRQHRANKRHAGEP